MADHLTKHHPYRGGSLSRVQSTIPQHHPITHEGIASTSCGGGHSCRETPGPIPNPEAKPAHADGTAPARVWESRTPPPPQPRGPPPVNTSPVGGLATPTPPPATTPPKWHRRRCQAPPLHGGTLPWAPNVGGLVLPTRHQTSSTTQVAPSTAHPSSTTQVAPATTTPPSTGHTTTRTTTPTGTRNVAT